MKDCLTAPPNQSFCLLPRKDVAEIAQGEAVEQRGYNMSVCVGTKTVFEAKANETKRKQTKKDWRGLMPLTKVGTPSATNPVAQ